MRSITIQPSLQEMDLKKKLGKIVWNSVKDGATLGSRPMRTEVRDGLTFFFYLFNKRLGFFQLRLDVDQPWLSVLQPRTRRCNYWSAVGREEKRSKEKKGEGEGRRRRRRRRSDEEKGRKETGMKRKVKEEGEERATNYKAPIPGRP